MLLSKLTRINKVTVQNKDGVSLVRNPDDLKKCIQVDGVTEAEPSLIPRRASVEFENPYEGDEFEIKPFFSERNIQHNDEREIIHVGIGSLMRTTTITILLIIKTLGLERWNQVYFSSEFQNGC